MDELVSREDRLVKQRQMEAAREAAILEPILSGAGLRYSLGLMLAPKTLSVEVHRSHNALFPKKEWGTIEGAERVRDISLVLRDLFAEHEAVCDRIVFKEYGLNAFGITSLKEIHSSPAKLGKETSFSARLVGYNGGDKVFSIDVRAEVKSIFKAADEFFIQWKKTMKTLHEQYGAFSMDIY